MAKTSGVGFVPVDLAGDKMEGFLELNADPVDPLDAATKQYVDGGFEDFDFKNSCYAATTANLTAAYDNGTDNDGVGATLTNNDTQAVFSIDGVSPPLGSRVLIKDQTNEFENGIYVVANVGSVSTDWVLERTVDFDGVLKVRPGNFVVVNNGTDNTQTTWLQTEEVSDVGVDDILFSQFGAGGGEGGLTSFYFKEPCYAATIENLTATYDNGPNNDGVGATLTNSGAQAAFNVDSAYPAPSIGARILVKDQNDRTRNGIYTIIDVGSVSTNWVLERAIDFNNADKIKVGIFVLVEKGNESGQAGFVLDQYTEINVVGTEEIVFQPFGASQIFVSSASNEVSTAPCLIYARLPAPGTRKVLWSYVRPSQANSIEINGPSFLFVPHLGNSGAVSRVSPAYFGAPGQIKRGGERIPCLGVNGIDTAVAGLTAVNNTLYAFPIFLKDSNYNRISFGVETADATAQVSVSFYYMTVQASSPCGVRAYEEDVISVDTTGIKTVNTASTRSLLSGYYMVCLRVTNIASSLVFANAVTSHPELLYTTYPQAVADFGAPVDKYGVYYSSRSVSPTTLSNISISGYVTTPCPIYVGQG